MRAFLAILAAVTLWSAASAAAQDPGQQQGLPLAKTHTLHGLVLDARLQPLAKAEVRTGTIEQLDAASLLAPAAVTDATGSFAVAVMPDSMYHIRLRVSALGFTTAVSDLAVVPALGLEHIATLVLEPARAIQGRVRDRQGKPVVDAVIESNDLFVSWNTWRLRDLARTDASGIFVLRGTPAQALRLRVSASGCYTRSLAPVDAGSPLDVTLEPSGFIGGIVVDAAGKPVAANLTVEYEGHSQEDLRTGADGTFRATWRHPSRCRVQAAIPAVPGGEPGFAGVETLNGAIGPTGQSEILTAPRQDLRITIAAPAAAGALRVRAVDEQGKALGGFRAAVVWNGSDAPDYSWAWLMIKGVAAMDGTAVLPPPQGREEQSGVVLLSSPGRAATTAKVEWQPASEGKGVELQVTMPAGVEAKGTVLDADGKPAAGALVWAANVAPGRTWNMQAHPDAVATDAGGNFRMDYLGEGTWYFQASEAQGRPATTPRRVKIGKDAVSPVTLKLPRLLDVVGRVEAALPPGAMLMQNERGSILGGDIPCPPMPIEADGRFRLTGVVEGSKTFTLIVPQSPRCGFQFTLACSPVRVVADSTEIIVALREHIGRVQGRVKCVNTQVPPQRLLVCAGNKVEQQMMEYQGEAFCPVNPDGTFELTQPAKARLLRVRDSLTGTALGDEVDCNVEADKTVKVELTIDVGEVHLRMEDEDAGEGGPGVLMRLAHAEDQQRPWWMFRNHSSGLDLRDAVSEVTLYLQGGQTSLHLERGSLEQTNQAGAVVFVGGAPTGGEPLADVEVQAGKVQELTLKIPRRRSH